MPWATFYKQSALLDGGLGGTRRRAVRMDTLVGASVCQLLTMTSLVAWAAVFSSVGPAASPRSANSWRALPRFCEAIPERSWLCWGCGTR